jgi:hypothetical protein
MRQAKSMATNACSRAVKGESLDTYFSTLPKKDFRIVMSDRECILVPKKGIGRYQCVVTHDGRTVTGAKTGFLD